MLIVFDKYRCKVNHFLVKKKINLGPLQTSKYFTCIFGSSTHCKGWYPADVKNNWRHLNPHSRFLYLTCHCLQTRLTILKIEIFYPNAARIDGSTTEIQVCEPPLDRAVDNNRCFGTFPMFFIKSSHC